jgi:putative transcriptional regulator
VNFENTRRLAVDDRPIDALLAGYAARTLEPPLLALIAAHLEMVPDNRAYVTALEAAHGIFLSGLDPVPLVGRDRRLVNIFASTASETTDGPCSACPQDSPDVNTIPFSLRGLLGDDLASLAFRPVAAGVERVIVATGAYGEASVLKCRPHLGFRAHGHSGLAAMLVLSGSFSDERGTYGCGAVSVADETYIHQPTVGPDGLVCFMVARDRLEARGRIRSLISRVLGD